MRAALLLLLGLAVPSSWAQGYISSGNRALGLLDAPVFDTDCQTRLAGAAYSAQVYAGTTPDSLQPFGVVQPFLPGAGAGYIQHVPVNLLGHPPGIPVWVQLRAWEAAAGGTYENAILAGGKHGGSGLIQVIPTAAPSPPAYLVGLQSFCLVPEPGAGALLALGGAVLALAARRGSFGGRFSSNRGFMRHHAQAAVPVDGEGAAGLIVLGRENRGNPSPPRSVA